MSVRDEKVRGNFRLYLETTLKTEERKRRQIAQKLQDDIALSVLVLARRLDGIIAARGLRLSQLLKEDLQQLHSSAASIYTNLCSCFQRPESFDSGAPGVGSNAGVALR